MNLFNWPHNNIEPRLDPNFGKICFCLIFDNIHLIIKLYIICNIMNGEPEPPKRFARSPYNHRKYDKADIFDIGEKICVF